jgi:hypothetical protein
VLSATAPILDIYMSKENKKRACHSQTPTRIIVERHYVGTEKVVGKI